MQVMYTNILILICYKHKSAFKGIICTQKGAGKLWVYVCVCVSVFHVHIEVVHGLYYTVTQL